MKTKQITLNIGGSILSICRDCEQDRGRIVWCTKLACAIVKDRDPSPIAKQKRKKTFSKGISKPLYCRPKLRGQALQAKTSPEYCPACKFKVRGANHVNGQHHKKKIA